MAPTKTPMNVFYYPILGALLLSACSSKNKTAPNPNTNGSIERIENFNSKFVTPRNIDVWLPKNYKGTITRRNHGVED